MAHHVDVLVDAGLPRVAGTRRVRALTERLDGCVARTIELTAPPDELPFLAQGRTEADDAAMRAQDATCGFTMRPARIPRERAMELFDRGVALAVEFSSARREYALFAGVFPTRRKVAPR